MSVETPVMHGPIAANSTAQDAEPVAAVTADTVNLTGNVGQVQARQINVWQGGIGSAKSDEMTVSVTQGGIGAFAAKHADVTVKGGGIGAMAAQEVNVHDTIITALAADRVNLSGNSRILIDMRAGVVFGVVVGVLLSATNAMLKMRLSRKGKTQ